MIGRSTFSRLPTHRLASPSCFRASRFLTCDRGFIRRPTQPFRSFSSTRRNNDDGPINHYEVLGIAQTATKAELKKQFYALSKETHPDRHPDDPKAGERFSQISESYSILADDEKRRRYDRDFFRQRRSNNGDTPGSFAGSRPASGLSKRRGTFRGPPPSFYAQGGYGSSNRPPSQEQQKANEQQNYAGGTFNAGAYSDRASDFDSQPIHRTQSAEDQRRMQRRAAEIRLMQAEIDAMTDKDFWGRFVIVSTIVFLGVTIGSMIVSMNHNPRGGFTRGDGSKRGEGKNEWAKG